MVDAITTSARQNEHGVVVENGVAKLTASDARAWSVSTEEGNVTATIDSFNSLPGPHPPGQQVEVGTNTFSNNGDVSGTVNAEFAEVDSNGNVVRSICSIQVNLNVGEQHGLTTDPSCGGTFEPPGSLTDTMPNEFGTTISYGLRVWGEDESQPPFPTPSAAGAGRQVAAQNPIDDVINDISEATGLPPEAIIASSVAVGGVTAGFVIEDQFDLIQ